MTGRKPAGTEDTLIVFTARSLPRILAEGGTQGWEVNPMHAKQMQWVVCTRNRNHPDPARSAGATEPHGSAFLVGRISDVVLSEEREEEGRARYRIVFSEYAPVTVPDVWKHWRNPVKYAQLAALGLDSERLVFEPASAPPAPAAPAPDARGDRPAAEGDALAAGRRILTAAKREIAQAFGVPPEAVEITIRA